MEIAVAVADRIGVRGFVLVAVGVGNVKAMVLDEGENEIEGGEMNVKDRHRSIRVSFFPFFKGFLFLSFIFFAGAAFYVHEGRGMKSSSNQLLFRLG